MHRNFFAQDHGGPSDPVKHFQTWGESTHIGMSLSTLYFPPFKCIKAILREQCNHSIILKKTPNRTVLPELHDLCPVQYEI